jgi:hypothetical protein
VQVSKAEIAQGDGVLTGLPSWFLQTLQSLKSWLSGQAGSGAVQVWGGIDQAVNSQTAGKVVATPNGNPPPVVKIATRTPLLPVTPKATAVMTKAAAMAATNKAAATVATRAPAIASTHHRQTKVTTPPMNRAWHSFVSQKGRR